MKKRSFFKAFHPGGILRWSTVCILASGAAGLSSCDSSVDYVATEKDAEMAKTQTQIEKLDSEKAKLMTGEVTNNFHIAKVGYYHADVRDFFEHPYGFEKDGRYFINGVWQDEAVVETTASSRPSPEALKKVEAALEQEQKVAGNSTTVHHHGGGFGMGNALMMYWLLSGNRGSFFPGNGFNQASGQAGNWQRGVDQQRSEVNRYAAANPGYQRMVQQSKASGRSVAAGQSVRGGFGASRRSSSSSFGS
jgi:hypothetical protein